MNRPPLRLNGCEAVLCGFARSWIRHLRRILSRPPTAIFAKHEEKRQSQRRSVFRVSRQCGQRIWHGSRFPAVRFASPCIRRVRRAPSRQARCIEIATKSVALHLKKRGSSRVFSVALHCGLGSASKDALPSISSFFIDAPRPHRSARTDPIFHANPHPPRVLKIEKRAYALFLFP